MACLGPAQQRFHDALHALLFELVGQLFQMRFAAQDEVLFRLDDGGGGDRIAPIGGAIAEAGLIRQGIDQPRLPLGLRPDHLLRVWREHLTRFLGVLVKQGLYLVL